MTGNRLAAAAAFLSVVAVSAAEPAAEAPKPRIQVALLLDTSGSMSGLIDQAKTRLWQIVNEFIPATREGKKPALEVALYEYGNDGLAQDKGWIRQITPLTDDLDKVSEELFKLTTNGGEEYCGQVIQTAVRDLAWSASKDDLKAIFIAGNEPFSQGPVDFRASCKAAIEKGIAVSTIFCGDNAEGVSTGWRDGAALADGTFMSIDQNQRMVQVDAPQDKEITRLNEALNGTYVAYGAHGKEGAERQMMQDQNALGAGASVNASRALSKVSGYYSNGSWDLCDACAQNTVKIEDVKPEDLPEEMRKMTVEERKAFVAAKASERQKIQEEIKKLDTERRDYVAAELKKRGEADGNALDKAVVEGIRKQASAKNFKF